MKKAIYGEPIYEEMFPADEEISALARLSRTSNALLKDFKCNGKYGLVIQYEDGSEKVILATDTLDRYSELTKQFYSKFIRYGGDISLEEVFESI